MMKLARITRALVSLCAFIHCAGYVFATQAADRPNVLFIFVDDLRTSLGCYGDTLAQSPNIDRLATTSRVFQRAYCHQAVCGPSRASVLTGRLPDNTGVWHNRNLFRTSHPELVTLPQLFKNNGYRTIGLGKVFSGDPREEDPQSWSVPTVIRAPGWKNYALPENNKRTGKGVPFEKVDGPDEAYPDGQLTELAIRTLETLKREAQPFFLAVGFFKPHLPFNAPKKYWDLYDPAVFDLKVPRTRTEGAPDSAYPDHLELAGYATTPEDERVSLEQARELRHGYYACVSYTDAQIGKLLSAMNRLGLDENTIVVLLGDHGYSLGEADHWCKATNFELDTHVPLMIRTPNLAHPGIATNAFTEYVDIYPTIASLASLPLPQKLDGQNLQPILIDPAAQNRDAVLSQFARPFAPGNPQVMGYSLRTQGHRYTRWIDWKSREIISEELYDYTSPTSVEQQVAFAIERKNVSLQPSYTTLLAQLRAQLDQTLATRSTPVTLPDRVKKRKQQ